MLKTIRSEAAFLVAAATAIVLYTVGKSWLANLASTPILVILFLWIFAVMLWAAFAAVRHADGLAELLGEPLGTLILTLSVISIEVSVIAAVMLNGDADPTLARDTMLSVLMIVLNGMVGLALLIGGIRHREQEYNLPGARSYLAVIITLATVSLILPRYPGDPAMPALSLRESFIFALMSLVLYGTFLRMQTTSYRSYFVQPAAAGQGDGGAAAGAGAEPASPAHGHGKLRSIPYHAVFLLLTLVPIVLLSKKLAVVTDYSVEAFGLPSALGGVLVAVLVLAPEALSSYRAAVENQLQRAVNICLGSALATIGLTVPAVVFISQIIGMPIELGLDPTEMVLLVLTLALSLVTFGGVRTNTLLGAVHLSVFAVYLVLIFDP